MALDEDLLEETAELGEEGSIADIPENVDLVDLIDRPAWKTILIQLVKSEKMNPWEIDISDLTTKYLTKVNALASSNLKVPANAILACALLLKFKSNFLRVSAIRGEEDLESVKRAMTPEEIRELEALLPDLQNIRKIREGKVSLDELVNVIDRMLQDTKRVQEKSSLRRGRTKFVFPEPGMQVEAEMEKVYKRIRRNADSQGLVTFARLLKETDDNESTVRTFIPCLFLMNKGRIFMWQGEFFGEIMISLNASISEQMQKEEPEEEPAKKHEKYL